MRLKVLLPTEILVDEQVNKVSAEAENGSFTLLPRHIDFVAALVPGILSFESDEKGEQFLGVDEGILVKCAQDVMVSTRKALRGPELGTLRERIQRELVALDEREKRSRSAAAKLEADLVRRFIELGEHG